MTGRPGRIIVVGGGIGGLTTALALADRANGTADIEVREGSSRVGGKLLATPFAGRAAVDEGADAFLARQSSARNLANRLGLGLTSPNPVGASVWHGRLHPIPDGLMLGVPAGLGGLARSRLLTWRGKARAGLEPLLPATAAHDSVGAWVRSRFGDEVHVRLVDALVGSIYGADTDRFSLSAVPQLAALTTSRSALLAARRLRRNAPPSTGPVFQTPVGGMGALAVATADAARGAGVRIRLDTPVHTIERDGPGWRVDGDRVDAVVLAGPAAPTATTLGADPALAGLRRLLATVTHATVVVVTAAVDSWPARLAGRSGYLLPKDVQQTVTAVSFGSQKWSHWGAESGRSDEVLRISLGRDGLDVDQLDDAEIVRRAVDETGRHLQLDLQPSEVRVSRWPGAFPQYRPGHAAWLEAVAAATPPGLLLTGASYRGIGVPAVVADAERTAEAVLGC